MEPHGIPAIENGVKGSSEKQPECTTFEEILQKIKPFGLFQIGVFLVVTLSDISASMCLQFFIYGAANPGYACIADDNLTEHDVIRDGMLVEPQTNDSGYVLNACEVNGTKCISRIYGPQFTSIITEWDLVCENGYYPTIITTLLMVGLGLGAAFFGHAADWWGRRPIFYLVTTLMMLCQFTQSFMPSWQLMAVARFLVGIFTGASIVIASITPIEFIGKGHRTVVGCLGMWGVGTFMLVFLAYFIRDWRELSITTALIFVLYPLTFFFMPESVRWLLQHNKIDEAQKVVERMAKVNKRECPPKTDLMRVAKSQEFSFSGKIKHYTYKDLLMNSKLRSRTLLTWYLWFCFAMMFYAIVLDVRDIGNDIYSNIAIMAALEYAFNLSVIYTAHRFGRRKSMIAYIVTNTVAMITVMSMDIATDTNSSGTLVTIRTLVSLVGRGGVAAAWGVGYLLSAELFPTPVRNIAASGCAVAGRIGGVVAPQIAYLKNYHLSIPYIIFASLSTMATILTFKFLPETKDRPLPDDLLSKEPKNNKLSGIDNPDNTITLVKF